MRKNRLVLSSVTALVLCGSAFADDAVRLDTIEVSTTSLGYQNVDAVKIQTRNASMARDILRDIPGVYVGGTNSFNQKIYMRGVNDRGLNITIDGARQKGNIFHHGADLVLDTDLLKAIDVSTGVNSVVGNSGALGGSVAFKTVDASDLLEPGQIVGAKVKGAYASNDDRYTGSIMLYTSPVEGLDLLGYYKYSDYDFGEDGNGNEIGGKGKDKSYMFKGSYAFLDSHKIGLSYEHVEYDGDYPFRPEFGGAVTQVSYARNRQGKIKYTYKPKERAQAILPQKMERDTYRFFYNYNPNDLIDLDFNAYYTDHSWLRDKMPEYKEAEKAEKASIMDGGVKTYGATLINKTILEQGDMTHTLRYGMEYYQSKSYLKHTATISAKNNKMTLKPSATIPDDKATSWSVFIEDQMKIGGLTITPGVRFDYYKLDTMGQGTPKYTPKLDDKGKPVLDNKGNPEEVWIGGIATRESYDWTEISPSLAIDYQFQNGLGLFGSYTRVFRGPDPIESIRLTYKTATEFAASDKLDPETGDAYEVGFRYGAEFGARHTFNLVTKYFYTDYDNLINEFASPDGAPGTTRVNAGSATVKGVEIAAKGQFGNLGVSAGYTHSSTNYKSEAKTGKGQSIYGGILGYSDSGDKYTFGVDYFIAPIDLLIGYNMIFFNDVMTTKEDENKKIVPVKKPAYATHDIYASWLPQGALEGLEINVGVYNIFDKTYYSHSQRGFGSETGNDWEPGRSVRASISYKF